MTDDTILRLRILIIDNDPADAERLKRKIEPLEHAVDIVTSPASAIKKVSSEYCVLKPYDLAIIEYWLHKKETGIVLGRKLLKIDDYLSIIIYTSDNCQDTYAEIMKSGLPIKGFFKKVDNINKLTPMFNYVMSNKKKLLSGETSFFKARLKKFKDRLEK